MNCADRYAQDLLDRHDDRPGALVAGLLWAYALALGAGLALIVAGPVIVAVVL